MNRQHSFFYLILFICFSTFNMPTTKGQARSGVGLAFGVNGSSEGLGLGFRFQGEVKVSRKVTVVPAIGVEIPYNVYAGLSGKYYFRSRFYSMLGPIAHLRSLEAGDSGIGGSAAVGYEFKSAKRSIVDLNLHTDVIQINGRTSPVIGLRVAYNFSFSRTGKK